MLPCLTSRDSATEHIPSRSFLDQSAHISIMAARVRLTLALLTSVLLPPSALASLSTLHIAFPMVFSLASSNATTHAGVLEFIAAEGHVYIPQWMFTQLKIIPGDMLTVVTTHLPLGTFVKIQPQSTSFLGITDPKAVLEHAFRSFSTLTKGDIFTISYNNTTYDILVMEVKPGTSGISIIETDLEVDFEAPLGYVEPERVVKKTSIEEHVTREEVFVPMSGSGYTLKGKAIVGQECTSSVPSALVLPFGKLFFGYPVVPLKKVEDHSKNTFKGPGKSLRAQY